MTDRAPLAPVRFRRSGPLVLLAIAAGLLYFLSPSWPHEQHVRIALADLAPRVVSVALQYSRSEGEEPANSVRFDYPAGQAPRYVEHTTKLPNERMNIDIAIDLANPPERIERSRNVRLEGETVILRAADLR